MCRHDSCWGICAWWSVKPDTSGKHFPQDVLFCPCVCLKIPSPGPPWAPPVRRCRTLGGVRVIHAQQQTLIHRRMLRYRRKYYSLLAACVGLLPACVCLSRCVMACNGLLWHDCFGEQFGFDGRRVAWHVNVANASEDEFLIVLVDVSAWLMLGHLRLVVCQARHFGKALSARRFVLPLRVPQDPLSRSSLGPAGQTPSDIGRSSSHTRATADTDS